jgi:membrane protein YfhO
LLQQIQLQWDLLLWMLACAVAGLWLWDRLFQPRLGVKWAAVLLGLALLPLLPSLRADRVLGPFDTNVRLRPWATRDQLAYQPKVGRLNDVTLQLAPWQAEVRRQMLAGRVPLLNPFSAGGQALLGNGQSAPFSPVSLLALPFRPERAQTLRAFLKILLALVGTFLAARRLGARPELSLVAAVAYAFSGSLAVWRLFPIGEVLALFPFAFLASEWILAEGPRKRSCALLAAALAAMLLAGHPETALAAACALAARWLWAAIAAWRCRDRSFPTALRGSLAAALLAVLGTAFFTLPVAESILRSERLAQKAREEEQEPRAESATLGGLISLGLPGIYGTPQRSREAGPAPVTWLAEGAVGLPAMLLALSGLFLPGARSQTERFLRVLTPVAYILHLDPLGLASRLFSLPGLSVIAPRYFSYLGGFGVALLVALALERWMGEPIDRRKLAVIAGLGALALLWAFGGHQAVLAFWRAQGFTDPKVLAESNRHLAFALSASAVTLSALGFRRPLRAGLLAAVAGLAQLLYAFGGYNPTIPAAYAYPPVPVLERIAREPGFFRLVGTRGVFVANSSTVYGLADIRTHDPTESSRYVDWLAERLDFDRAKYKKQYPRPRPAHVPYLRLLGVRFLLAGPDLPVGRPWIDRGVFRETRLWELPGEVHGAFFPRLIVPVRTAAEARAAIHGLRNLYKLASIELGSSAPREQNGVARVERVEFHTPSVDLSVSVQSAAWLVVSQTAIPGWRAWADGRPARVAIADGTLLAVHVPAGTSKVRLRYSPASWRLGCWLLLVAVLGAYPALSWCCRQRKGDAEA